MKFESVPLREELFDGLKGAVMVCGTASDVGKSQFVAGLCKLLNRHGVSVAPFKGQNMALNSFVTHEGLEIGRAQATQAQAGGAEPEVAMNPVLLKPTGEHTSQVVVMGRPWAEMDATSYQLAKQQLRPVVLNALADLRNRFDVVVCEGAGSPAEINLMKFDLVNLGLAEEAGISAVLIGDIERGGVFASLYGTLKLLPAEQAKLVGGFVVNKFRGDRTLLEPGIAQIEQLCEIPSLGVIPFVRGLNLDAEDSLHLVNSERSGSGQLEKVRLRKAVGQPEAIMRPEIDHIDVAVIRFPHIANFTDFDPLFEESAASVRYVSHDRDLLDPDLVILPGSKNTVRDLAWLRASRLVEEIEKARFQGTTVLGICGGYQMLGCAIEDEIESRAGLVKALGWLDVRTVFGNSKVTLQRVGHWQNCEMSGYQIHHGRVQPLLDANTWLTLESTDGDQCEGVVNTEENCFGTTLHGLFESDAFRVRFLDHVARRRGKRYLGSSFRFAQARSNQHNLLADLIADNIDMSRLQTLIASQNPASQPLVIGDPK